MVLRFHVETFEDMALSSEDAIDRSPTDGDRERDQRMDDTTTAIHRVHESHSAMCRASGRQCRVLSLSCDD